MHKLHEDAVLTWCNAPLQSQGPLGNDVAVGLDGSLSFAHVVGWWSDCAVDATLKAAGPGIVRLAYDDWAADEHLEKSKKRGRQKSKR